MKEREQNNWGESITYDMAQEIYQTTGIALEVEDGNTVIPVLD